MVREDQAVEVGVVAEDRGVCPVNRIKDAVDIVRRRGLATNLNMNLVSDPKDGDQLMPFSLLAKELGVPVIVLAQLNRDIERDKKRKPRLSDLRESGSIEQDADLVGMLYIEDETYASMSDSIPVNLLVNKHRNGAVGEIALTFLKSFTKFESHSPIDQ